MTLNQLASNIALRLNDPYNHVLKEQIKDSYKSLRAKYISQSIEKHGIENNFILTYDVDLEIVDKADHCNLNVGCNVAKTVNPIPNMLGYTTDVPFNYVGTIDWYGFIYCKPTEIRYRKYLEHLKEAILYHFTNNYIYVYNTKVKQIRIQAVFSDPAEVINLCSSTECYNDDMEFPVQQDMLEVITTELLKVYGVLKPENKEVELNDKQLTPNK